MAGERLWIVGPGRVGLSLGALLHRLGTVDSIVFTGRGDEPPEHPVFRTAGSARYQSNLTLPDPPPTGILLTVPDSAIQEVAARLAALELPAGVPVLHTSGVSGAEVLAPLAERGVPVGSIHPLAAVPSGDSDRLRGAWFALEGDEPAVLLGRWIVEAVGGQALPVPAGGKPLYHTAAVFASNYVVTLLSVAERLAAQAGIPEATARAALTNLAAGAVANAAAGGAESALTGPVARGDAGTVERHVSRLSGPERSLYSVLARETLALARRAGLGDAEAAELERVLGGGEE